MAEDRCQIIGGPCIVTTGAATYITESDVTLQVRPEYRDIQNALLGKIGQKKTDQIISVRFTPIGRPEYVTSLIPDNVADIGSDIMGCVDMPMTIQGQDGTNVQLKAVGVSKPPTLTFAPNKSLFGEVEFMAVVSNNADVTTAASVVAITTGNAFTIPEEACDVSAIIERAASAAWGAVAPFDAIEMTEDGAELTIEYGTEAKKTAANGTIGYRLTEVTAKVKLRPANLTEQDFFNLFNVDGPNAAMGEEAVKNDLTLEHLPAAGGLTVLLRQAYPDDQGGSMVWAPNQNRIGEVTLRGSVSCDENNGNALLAPFLITVNPAA